MPHLSKQKIIIAFVICLVLSASEIFACSCVSLANEDVGEAVKYAAKQSTAVFAGKVVGFEYRKGIPNEYMKLREEISGKRIDYKTLIVKFQVESSWKGELASEIFLVTDQTKNSDGTTTSSSCDYVFKEGEIYLVYANGKENELRTHACTRTRPLKKAEEDLKFLGKGNKSAQL
jgi:hypothetical protein